MLKRSRDKRFIKPMFPMRREMPWNMRPLCFYREKTGRGAVANSDGDFSMEAEAGKYRLVVQCLGYEPFTERAGSYR